MIKINIKLLNSSNYLCSAMRVPKPVLKSFEQKLLNAKIIDVHTHCSPDEDTVNSAKVIYRWIKGLGKDVSICVNPKETKGLFFKNSKNIKIKTDLTKKSDLAFVCDFNSTERISEKYRKSLEVIKEKDIIGLDHHISSGNTISENIFIDVKARSNCGLTFRFLNGLKIKWKKADLESLYCGMLSDYRKSKLINIANTSEGSKLVKLPNLYKDKKAKNVLAKLESKLNQNSKDKIYKHLDILSRLTPAEKAFRTNIVSHVQVTKNGELAYIVIPPGDNAFKLVGGDNTTTSTIMSDLRPRLLNPENEPIFPPKLKAKLKNVKGAMIFYPTSEKGLGIYQMSIHSKTNYANILINYIKKNLNSDLIAGGHADRAGGRVMSCKKQDVEKFIEDFLTAAVAQK